MYANGSNIVSASTTIPVANVTGAVPNTVNVLSSGLLSGGGPLTGNVTISLSSVPVENVPGAVPNTVNVLSGGLLTGGGALTGNVTISLANVPSSNVTGLGTMATQNANNVAITGGKENAVTYTNVTISSGTFVGANVKVSNGVYSTNTFNSVYTDGIVMDYATGNGRISVGAGDGITFYNGGVANVVLGNVTSGGVWNLNNLVSSNVSVTGGNVSANIVQYNTNTAATATFATPSLPLVPAGYLFFNLNGTLVKVPYYGV
jgi:hypothetical protein